MTETRLHGPLKALKQDGRVTGTLVREVGGRCGGPCVGGAESSQLISCCSPCPRAGPAVTCRRSDLHAATRHRCPDGQPQPSCRAPGQVFAAARSFLEKPDGPVGVEALQGLSCDCLQFTIEIKDDCIGA